MAGRCDDEGCTEGTWHPGFSQDVETLPPLQPPVCPERASGNRASWRQHSSCPPDVEIRVPGGGSRQVCDPRWLFWLTAAFSFASSHPARVGPHVGRLTVRCQDPAHQENVPALPEATVPGSSITNSVSQATEQVLWICSAQRRAHGTVPTPPLSAP